MHGIALVADPDETYQFIDELYEKGSFTFDRLAIWLRAHCRS